MLLLDEKNKKLLVCLVDHKFHERPKARSVFSGNWKEITTKKQVK
jgi:hypothetical protein